MLITDHVRDYVPDMEKGSMAGANQLVHWFLGGKGLGIQQGASEYTGGLVRPNLWGSTRRCIFFPCVGR